MTPDQRRAHLILHGQTLLDAWQARGKLWDEGDKLYTKANKLRAEGDRLRAKSWSLWHRARRRDSERCETQADSLMAAGVKLRKEGSRLYSEGSLLWREAVAAEFGHDCTRTWDGNTCALGCGEIYKPDGETACE